MEQFPLITFDLFEEAGIAVHAFTTRMGGVSEGIYATLNFSFHRGDKREAVEENYRRLAAALGVSYESFACCGQAHTANVVRVGAKDAGNGISRRQEYPDADGMVTNERGVTLVTFHADCVPLYFVDPVHHAIGLSHAGWRGTAGRMAEQTLKKMQLEFGTDPADVLCAIGPSICRDCYEVGEDVASEFRRAFSHHAHEILTENENGKYQLGLWDANRIALLEAGVPKAQIALSGLCTCCNPALLFSHRASKGKRGNLAAVLALR